MPDSLMVQRRGFTERERTSSHSWCSCRHASARLIAAKSASGRDPGVLGGRLGGWPTDGTWVKPPFFKQFQTDSGKCKQNLGQDTPPEHCVMGESALG